MHTKNIKFKFIAVVPMTSCKRAPMENVKECHNLHVFSY